MTDPRVPDWSIDPLRPVETDEEPAPEYEPSDRLRYLAAGAVAAILILWILARYGDWL